MSPALAGLFLTTEPPGKPHYINYSVQYRDYDILVGETDRALMKHPTVCAVRAFPGRVVREGFSEEVMAKQRPEGGENPG